MRYAAIICLALSACSPGNACTNYGFEKGTTAFAQCVQNEVLAQRLVQARVADMPSWTPPPRGRSVAP